MSKLISLADTISYLYYKPVYYCVSSCAEMTCIIALLCMIIQRIKIIIYFLIYLDSVCVCNLVTVSFEIKHLIQ